MTECNIKIVSESEAKNLKHGEDPIVMTIPDALFSPNHIIEFLVSTHCLGCDLPIKGILSVDMETGQGQNTLICKNCNND